ncbi:nuclear transport factor 2 family protein [Lacibacter sp. H375]|uniref:nuclear transport factor 2 family protein n=1 Tax=Lacibacter sp. H375 TaxID=3133424 RepID=UPI0030BB2B03
MMQKIKVLLVVLLFSASASAQSTQEEKRVQQAVENMFATLTNADTAALKTFVAANVHFYEYGQVWTIDTLIQKVIQGASVPGFKRTNSFEFVSTTINKNTAWVTYYLQSTITRNGKDDIVKWMETVVLIKQKKQWKINVLHSTRLPKN